MNIQKHNKNRQKCQTAHDTLIDLGWLKKYETIWQQKMAKTIASPVALSKVMKRLEARGFGKAKQTLDSLDAGDAQLRVLRYSYVALNQPTSQPVWPIGLPGTAGDCRVRRASTRALPGPEVCHRIRFAPHALHAKAMRLSKVQIFISRS